MMAGRNNLDITNRYGHCVLRDESFLGEHCGAIGIVSRNVVRHIAPTLT
jgi:hypothetical protein